MLFLVCQYWPEPGCMRIGPAYLLHLRVYRMKISRYEQDDECPEDDGAYLCAA